jgi:hypothetical protein
MVKYKCKICPYETEQKSHYEKHLNKKKPCSIDIIIKFICEYCNYEFPQQNLLNRHIENHCKIKKDIEKTEKNEIEMRINNLENENIKLKEMLAKLIANSNQITNDSSINNNTNCNNTTNTTNTNNINNNITNNNVNQYMIVNFGKENIDKLSKKEKQEILHSSYAAVFNCIKKMNFNPDIPEQNNIFITNPKADFAFKYENGIFIAAKTKDLIDELIVHRSNNVRELIEQNDELKVPRVKIERVNNSLQNIDEEKEKDITELRSNIRLILFNQNKGALVNKEKIENNKKILKKK